MKFLHRISGNFLVNLCRNSHVIISTFWAAAHVIVKCVTTLILVPIYKASWTETPPKKLNLCCEIRQKCPQFASPWFNENDDQSDEIKVEFDKSDDAHARSS